MIMKEYRYKKCSCVSNHIFKNTETIYFVKHFTKLMIKIHMKNTNQANYLFSMTKEPSAEYITF